MPLKKNTLRVATYHSLFQILRHFLTKTVVLRYCRYGYFYTVAGDTRLLKK